jgi:hypothetical protein
VVSVTSLLFGFKNTSATGSAAAAAAGAANGKITLAQADSAVAMAQTEKVDRLNPISRTAWQN